MLSPSSKQTPTGNFSEPLYKQTRIIASAAHRGAIRLTQTGCPALPTTTDWRAGAEGEWKQGAALRGTKQWVKLNERQWDIVIATQHDYNTGFKSAQTSQSNKHGIENELVAFHCILNKCYSNTAFCNTFSFCSTEGFLLYQHVISLPLPPSYQFNRSLSTLRQERQTVLRKQHRIKHTVSYSCCRDQ